MNTGGSISQIGVIGATVAIATMLCTTVLNADSVCVQGYRDTTAAERRTMANILETAIQALPPAPQGWVISDDGSVDVTSSLCKDDELIPWRYGFNRSYQRVDSSEERNDMIKAAADDMAADLDAKQPRIDAIIARNTELSMEAMAAAQKSDFERVDTINAEIDAGVEEIQRIYEEGPAPQRVQAATTEANRDLDMRITITINPSHESPGYQAVALSAPAGAQAAFRWNESDPNVKDDNALVLLGNWKPSAEGNFDLIPRTGVAACAVHGIAVSVNADENRLTSMLDSIDWNSLPTAFSE